MRAALVVAALGAALVPTPAPAVERFYSTGAYPAFQSLLTSAANLVPFALLDVLICGTLLLLAIETVRNVRVGWVRSFLHLLQRIAVWGSALYLAFLLAWGLNYRRVPLADKLRFEPSAVTSDRARDFAHLAASELQKLHEPAHRSGWPASDALEPSLAGAFATTLDQIGVPRDVTPGRPKRTALDWFFRRGGVNGMIDPFFLETLVVTGLLPFERPFVVAHEWSHLAGFADEGEANFVGWLTCLHGSPGEQYSGWLFLYGEVVSGLRPRDRTEVLVRLASGPREDLQAMADRLRRQVDPRLASAGWRVYDSYLKANRIEAGAASYAQVVRLALGVRFADGWLPQLR